MTALGEECLLIATLSGEFLLIAALSHEFLLMAALSKEFVLIAAARSNEFLLTAALNKEFLLIAAPNKESLLKHVTLTGKGEDGIYRTAPAKTYNSVMCKVLADATFGGIARFEKLLTESCYKKTLLTESCH